jgi:ankyrin repeat protein
MTKLAISRDEWLNAACYGDLARLEAWNRSGALDIKYDPVRLGANVPQGRAKIFDVSDTDKENALHRAIRSNQVAYALRLLELGRFLETRNTKGETPLMQAAELAQEGVVSTLIQAGHGVNVQDKKGRTALSRAVNKKSVPVANLLLEAGASIKTSSEMSPLMEAVNANHPELVRILLNKGADPNEENPLERGSCFHRLACHWDKEDSEQQTPRRQIMRLLIQAGADTQSGVMERDGTLTSLRDLFYYKPGFDVTLPCEVSAWQADQLDKETAAPSSSRRSSSPRL